MQKEIWRDIEGYEGYQISNYGNVKSFRRDKIKGKILKPCTTHGYLLVRLYSNKDESKMFRIHRLVALHFLELVDGKNIVNHIDGNKTNNYVENLEWSNISQNTQHAYDNNLINHRKGEDVHTSKLTEDDVRYIRRVYIKGSREFGQRALARKFEITHSTIQSIVSRKTWKHI